MNKISRMSFVNYISSNNIVWQMWDGLIESTKGLFELPCEVKELVDNINIADVLIVKRNEMLNSSFRELAEWSTDNDILVLIDNKILFCLPQSFCGKFVA